jgi:hypothetical protein
MALTGRPERRISDLVLDLAPMQEASDVADLFAALARSIVKRLHADACLVSICDDEFRYLRDIAASVVPPVQLNTIAEQYWLQDYPTTKKILETRSHVELSLGDASTDIAERILLEQLGFNRLLLCSFAIGNDVIGTVEVFRIEDRPFRHDDPEQVELMVAFAGNNYSRIQLNDKLETHYTETIAALTSALEARDPYTQAHTGRIRDLALALAVAMQVPNEVRKAVSLGALLHDVGKIGVSDIILGKTGALTDEEWATMRKHPVIGERMLTGVDFLRVALPVVRHHHERWDGGGYPDKLRGEEIPLAARIVAVCDAYDAMTSDRPYRSALSISQACRELLQKSGTQFDPRCAAMLVEVVAEIGERDIEEKFVRYAV